jgi:uncharacterized protein (TIGR03067 family)
VFTLILTALQGIGNRFQRKATPSGRMIKFGQLESVNNRREPWTRIRIMTNIAQFLALIPVIAAAQPSVPQPEMRERQSALYGLERDGLPLAAILDSPEVQVKAALVGTWQASYCEHGGQSRPDLAAEIQMKFTRGKLELIQRGRRPLVVAYNVSPQRTPAGFVWRVPDGGIMFQDGVYYLEGDTLVICIAGVNAPPAAQFVTQPGDGKTLYVLRRIER